MSRGSLVLATNQGLLYVLAMVVIAVWSRRALGYDVVYGLAHSDYAGKVRRRRISIVLLGSSSTEWSAGRRPADSRVGAATREHGSPPPSGRTWPVSKRRDQRCGNTEHEDTACRAVLASAALALTACGGGGSVGAQTKKNEKQAAAPAARVRPQIIVNNWVGYTADAYVLGNVAKKSLGCNVSYVDLKEGGPSYQALASVTATSSSRSGRTPPS